ncbi:MAG: M1 family metallopeptidase [Sandaracinaceae bacterium]|nr:M1 family metallopeptidase [Sandaracinaceae bacterium]
MPRLAALVAAALAASCGGPATAPPEFSAAEGRAYGGEADAPPSEAGEPIPVGRLPEGVTPLHYTLWLEVVPSRERFRGRADIRVRLDAPRRVIWLHGHDLNVTEAEVLPEGREAVLARYEEVHDSGVAALHLEREVGPGEVEISLGYDAPFDRQLKGLYRVDTGGESYAFTQFEATSARYAFPCFDEPRFKTPFDLTLSVSPAHEAIANTLVVSTERVEGMKEVRFAETLPLPTYLVAMAVGPLDVVEHAPIPPSSVRSRPLPFRGVAARGRGPRLAYALEHTAALLAWLEEYFGIEYPYDKLDIIAVPDFASGAMENAGAITFREVLLLLDPDEAPEDQRRGFAHVMAHELAHQWFGNLVTMPWWDDIWLNEAFATWMGTKCVHAVHPAYQADVGMVRSVHYAMGADSLVSARRIRQPIETNHDIRNAFDAITYRKGGGVLEMFERWMGEATFRDGIREHLRRHAHGTATATDLLDALGHVAERDVATPFETFLEQPGVPLLEATRSCGAEGNALVVRQRRYLPVGSAGDADQRWQVPVCVRFAAGRDVRSTCALVTEPEARIDLGPRCPDWVMPNAGAAGYYRWTLPREDVARLTGAGWRHLDARERLSVADALSAAYHAGTLDAAAVLGSAPRLAADGARYVALEPMGLLSFAHDHVARDEAERARVEAFAERTYRARARALGWGPRAGRAEDGETALLRQSVLSFLASTARSEAVRREAARRGRAYLGEGALRPDAVEASLVPLALSAAVEEGDEAFFDALLERALASDDALFRGHALAALGATRDPALATRALRIALDPRLRVNELTITLERQLAMRETRDAAWVWLTEHFDEVFARAASTRAGYAPWAAAGFCSEARAAEVAAFFAPRIEALPGGPRNLAGALEAIRLCAARVEAQRESTLRFFAR